MSNEQTHNLCEACWAAKHPDRPPVKARGTSRWDQFILEVCCFCGAVHSSGIYVSAVQDAFNCGGIHAQPILSEQSAKFDVAKFLENYKHSNPSVFIFVSRAWQCLFPEYSPLSGLPVFREVCLLVARGWYGHGLLDGGAFPKVMEIAGGSDSGWYAATIPIYRDREYSEFSLNRILSGFAAKMLQLQREERARYDLAATMKWPWEKYRYVAFADRAWATFRKKCAAFIAA